MTLLCVSAFLPPNLSTPSTPAPLAQNREFETSNNLLTLEIDHAAFGVAQEMRWRNTVGGARLFFIHQVGATHDDGGSIRNFSAADAPAVPLQAGKVYFLPANQEISGHFRDGLWLTGFHLRLEAIAGLDAFSSASAIRSRADQVAVIGELAALAGRDLELHEMVRVRGLVHAVASLFVDRSLGDLRHLAAMRGKYQAIFAAMAVGPITQLSVKGLARLQGMTREQLSRSFARDLGMPLKSYLMRRVVAQIGERLARSATPVGELAREFGFSTAGYFSRFFRAHSGVTPLAYRRMRQKTVAAL